MATKLTDAVVRALKPPATGNRITYDSSMTGFGVRVTCKGVKAFVLNYVVKRDGKERRLTIGKCNSLTVSKARDLAHKYKHDIAGGGDPVTEDRAERAASTVKNLAERFEREHLPKRRESTRKDYAAILAKHVLPALGKIKVADLRHQDVERMHRKIAEKAPYRANRAVAILSKMLNLAIKWELIERNVAIGLERSPEAKRERFLTPAELVRLGDALTAHAGRTFKNGQPDLEARTGANALRLLLLTGARRGEVMAAEWSQFELTPAVGAKQAQGVWIKPAANTKQKREHRIPLNAAAALLLLEMHEQAKPGATFVFPSVDGPGHVENLKRVWRNVCKAAKLDGVRVHDLRHTYASILASSGLSLPIIGALLGHTQQATTARYAHLLDDPLRAATERAGAIISGKPSAEVVPIKRHG